MPDKRTHRGPAPGDKELFTGESVEILRRAVADYSLLLTKGYAEKSSLKLVGDRFSLTARQRLAVMRNSCTDNQLRQRKLKAITIDNAKQNSVVIDGYNLLITAESALSDGFIFLGRDGCCRDLASIHGTYRKVTETIPGIMLIGRFFAESGIASVKWLLDAPVSNSAKLKTLMAELSEENDWQWDINLSANVDKDLMKSQETVVTSDGVVLDNCKKWLNAGRMIVKKTDEPRIVNLEV